MRYNKVLLVSPEYNFPNPRGMYPNGGLLSIGTLLESKGCEVQIIHMVPDKYNLATLEEAIRGFRPDLVGITVTTFQTKSAKAVARIVKEIDWEIPVVIGGPHVSAVTDAALKEIRNADIAFYGDAEQAMVDLVEGRDVETGRHSVIKDLDSLPFPDLSLIHLDHFTSTAPPGPRPSMSIMASRGCPFRCGFCSKSVFGNTVRQMSPERVVGEVEYLHKRWGVQEIFFVNDIFNLKRDWAIEVFELLIKKGLDKLRYKCMYRANEQLVDLPLLKLAKRAGLWLIFYGVESGNQDMLNRMQKDLELGEIRRAFALTHKAGIRTTAAIIVGYPGETPETIKQSQELAVKLKPFWLGFSRLTPFPGTRVCEEVKEAGHLLETNYDNYRPDRVLARTEAMTADEIEAAAKKLDDWTYQIKMKHLLTHPAMAYQVLKDRV